MKKQVIKFRNLIRLKIEDRDKTFSKKTLACLKGILVLNKIVPELVKMIIAEDLL